MPRDYYIVLGIDRGADPAQIKHAYRSAIKRLHPDMVEGDINPRRFIEACEAYEVLSDNDKRRAYDAELIRRDIPIRRSPPAETITPFDPVRHGFRERPSILDAFFGGFIPGFYRPRPRARAAPRDLYMEIILSPEEARRGGIYPVKVPVWQSCPDCRHADRWETLYCPTCRGAGAIQSFREFDLTIPPNIQHGLTADVPMEGIGLHGVRLTVDVQVR